MPSFLYRLVDWEGAEGGIRAVKTYICPVCHNEEHLPGARFCMVCGTGFPLKEQPPSPGPCSLCDFGGRHLDAPPCATCPATRNGRKGV